MDEDDYMSMAFLDDDSSTKKTKTLTYSEKRRRQIALQQEKGQLKPLKERGIILPLHIHFPYIEINEEQEAREKGLSTNILEETDNKGFLLMSKMGFK